MPPCARNGNPWSGGALSLLSLVLSLMSLTHRRKKGPTKGQPWSVSDPATLGRLVTLPAFGSVSGFYKLAHCFNVTGCRCNVDKVSELALDCFSVQWLARFRVGWSVIACCDFFRRCADVSVSGGA